MRARPGTVPLKTDAGGHVLVVIAGGFAWVIDKLGRYAVLEPSQLGRHLDIRTDPVFNVGVSRVEKDEVGN